MIRKISTTLLSPAITLMGRMPFFKKFALLWLISLAAICVTLYALYSLRQQALHDSRLELDGLVTVRQLVLATRHVQAYRNLAVAASGDAKSARAKEEKDIDAALAALQNRPALNTRQADFQQDISSKWQRIKANGLRWDRGENFIAHTELIREMLAGIGNVSDDYGLTSDPEHDVFYLARAATIDLPESLEIIRQVRSQARNILEGKIISDQQKVDLTGRIALLNDTVIHLNASIEKAAYYNPGIHDDLMATYAGIQKVSWQMSDTVRSDMIGELFSISLDQFLDIAANTIDQGYSQILQTLLPTVEKLIRARLQHIEAVLLATAAIALLFLSLAAYLMAAIYRTTRVNIHDFSQAAAGFARGDMNGRVRLKTRDEFSQIGDSFNRMAGGLSGEIEACQAELDKLQKIADRVPGMVYQYRLRPDGSACIPYASGAIRQIFRIDPQDVHENVDMIFAAIHAEDRGDVAAFIHASAENLSPWCQEFRVKFEDGAVNWLSGHAIPRREEDGSTLWHGYIEDITARKDNEVQIDRMSRVYRLLIRVNEVIPRSRGRNEFFAEMCDSAVESGMFRFAWVAMLDAQRLAVFPAAYAGVEEWYTGKFNICMDEEQAGNDPTVMAIRSDSPVYYQDIQSDPGMELLREDALGRGYFSLGVFPVHEAGAVTGAINVYAVDKNFFTPEIIQLLQALAADLSFALDMFAEKDRKESGEEKLRQLNIELENRVRERTRELEAISYSISHDLRAPLLSIDGFSQILARKYQGQLDASGRDYLGRMSLASQRLVHLIDDMLRSSQEPRGALRIEPVDLSGLAESVAENLLKDNTGRALQFSVHSDMAVYADLGLMRIVMDNLIGNACKHTGNKPVAEIEIGACGVNGERAFYVRDNGEGFNMDHANKLFNTVQKLNGAGDVEDNVIGLPAVQRIIHRHHGKVWAEAEEGKGATFYFTLPQRTLDAQGMVEGEGA